ncbi:MAG: hypothetical protein H6662_03785 [Ardenticatenaceae bacterium]|nr:hypothetical protein [Ardenticatenaceae bacterium]
MTKVLELALLGQVHLKQDGKPLTKLVSAKARALLFFLAVDGRTHTRHSLANLLWGDLQESDARRNLRGDLLKLRQHLAPYLEISHHHIAFNFDAPHQLDVAQFRQLLSGNPASAQLEEATELYRGDFLEEFYVRQAPEFEEWMLQQRAQLQQHAVKAFLALAEYYRQNGNYEAGIASIRRLLTLEPVREDAHRQLMSLLALHGQRGAALAQFEACRTALKLELGVDPSQETAVLYQQIRTGSFTVAPTPPRPSPPHPPQCTRAGLHCRAAHHPSGTFLRPSTRTQPPLQPPQTPPPAKRRHHRPTPQR